MIMRTTNHSRLATTGMLTAALAAAVLWTISPAAGQDALGGGDALDANLSTTTSRNLATPDESLAYRVRNLLVTGNVVGGRGFRDTVGYTAETDFRGSLGSDDLFRFRAESAMSSPTYVLFRNQLSDLQLGQDLGSLEFRREFTGETLRDVNAQGSSFAPRRGDTELRIDRLITDVSAAENLESWVESRPIGVSVDDEGKISVPTTTSVLGIDTMSYTEARATAGMSVLDRLRLREDYVSEVQRLQQQQRILQSSQQPGQPGEQPELEQVMASRPFSDIVGARLETRFEDLVTWQNRLDTMEAGGRVEPTPSGYDEVLESVAERYADGQGLDEETAGAMDDEYSALRRYLQGQPQPTDETDEMPVTPETQQPEQPGMTVPGVEDSGTEDEGESETPTFETPAMPAPGADVTPTLESFGIALRHGKRISSFATGNNDRFNELVNQAQESLNTGEYFWAERRFTRALLFRPNHPLATAGRVHAQIGAGLYLPAALSLRQLFNQYPEMIDVRYERDLLPPRTRLVQCVQAIRQRLEQGQDQSKMGLLLAYIGHQWDDQAMVDEGLAAMKSNRADDPLLPLLRTVWQAPREDSEGNGGGE